MELEFVAGRSLIEQKELVKAIYKDCFPMIKDYVTRNGGVEEDAKDVFQDAMIVLCRNINKPEFCLTSKVSTYLFAISRNIWLKKLRDSKIKTVDFDPVLHNVVEFQSIEEQSFTSIQKQLGKLLLKSGELCYKVLRLFYYENMSMSHISESMGYSSEQVAKNQKLRCLKKVRLLLRSTEFKDITSYNI